jgi:hypothetical protein
MTAKAFTPSTAPHEPTEACFGWHCHDHRIDEVSESAYRRCIECGHLYLTPEELQREWTANAPPDMPDRETPPAVERIYFCPLCMHDF